MTAASALARRTQALENHFAMVARTRMAGLPVMHAAMPVEAIGFAPLGPGDDDDGRGAGDEADAGRTGRDAAGPAALGVLLTPWFMNLVWLPLQADPSAAGVGTTRTVALGGERLAFIVAHEPAIGRFATCSLYSPVFEFADAGTARATALAALALLRTPAQVQPARRAFLFGRPAAAR